MAKKPGTNPKGEFAFFNVVYEDDLQRSNRCVPSELLGGLDGDEPARGYILEQDREIAEKSGRAPLAIKASARSGRRRNRSRSDRANNKNGGHWPAVFVQLLSCFSSEAKSTSAQRSAILRLIADAPEGHAAEFEALSGRGNAAPGSLVHAAPDHAGSDGVVLGDDAFDAAFISPNVA